MKNLIQNNKELKDAHIKIRNEHFEKELTLNNDLITIMKKCLNFI